MKTLAKDLKEGDKMPAPAHQRKWLKTPVTVLAVKETFPDKRGPWLLVSCEFDSPYAPQKGTAKFKFRPNTEIETVLS